MKTSLKILTGLGVLLMLAVAFAIIAPSHPLEGLAGLTLAFPVAFGIIQNSDDARQERKKVWDSMQTMIEARKIDKREFTQAESTVYDQLRKDWDKLDKMVAEMDADEKRRLQMAGLAAQKMHFSNNEPDPQAAWYDTNKGEVVNVFSRGQSIAQQFRNDDNLSLGRAIRALVSGSWKGAEAEQRALATTSGTGLLVPIGLFATILDLARAKSICFNAGASFLPMPEGSMRLAKLSTDPTMEIKAENEAFSENGIAFEALKLESKTIGGLVLLSRELAQDSPNVAQAIEQALAAALAAYLDKLAIFGEGGTEPTGITNAVGVQTVEVDNVLSYSKLLNAWGKIAGANGNPATIALSPRDMAALAGSVNDYSDFLRQPQLLEKLQWLHSSVLPTDLGDDENESIALVGDFSQVIFGLRQDAMIEISAVAGDTFKKHQMAIKLTFRGDIGIMRPDHFVKLTGTLAQTELAPEAPPLG